MSSSGPARRTASHAASLDGDEQTVRKVAGLIAESFAGGEVAVSFGETGRGRWRLTIHFVLPPDERKLRALAAAAAGPQAARGLRFFRLTVKDWVGESLAGLKPVMAGRFAVHGAHDRSQVAANRVGIEIEAALAFGTGHHATTRGCLLALDRLCKANGGKAERRILDLGTGTGVLAIAAARALRRRVLASDIDANAVRVARANARLNRIAPLVTVVRANGLNAGAITARAPYDLILANILLAPLQRLATPLTRLIAPGARIVLSGIMTRQANAVLAAYHALALESRIELDGWTTLVLRRPA